jgi:hypothetical protein
MSGSASFQRLRKSRRTFSSCGRRNCCQYHGTADYNHQPRLVFARYGKEVFLDKIFLSSNGNGRELLPGSREKMLIEKRASGEELSLLIQPAR